MSQKILNSATQKKRVGTPAVNPPAGYVYEYVKADGLLYSKDENGVEVLIGIPTHEGAMTANVGQTQATGTQVTKEYSKFDVVANLNDSATLDNAIAGKRRVVANNGAFSMRLYPTVGDKYDGAAVDAKIDLPSISIFELYCWTDGIWSVL